MPSVIRLEYKIPPPSLRGTEERKIPSARRYIDYYQETAANVLENYVEQTPISAWIYIVIFAGMAVLIALCIGWRVWRAANENPAEVVKSE